MRDRDTLIQQILGPGREDAGMGELSGVLGVGKTYLLERMDTTTRTKHMLPILVSIDEYDPGHHGEVGEKASVGAVQANFHRYRQLLAALLDRGGASKAICEQFDAAVADAYNADVLGRRVFSLEDSVNELSTRLDPSDLAQAWREAADTVTGLFVGHWTATANDQPRLLLLDNVDAVADQELGVWLGHLLPQLVCTITVTTREPGEPGGVQVPVGKPTWRTEIGNLEPDDVQDYLARRVSGEVVPQSVVQRICEVTHGHPATLTIVQRLIWGPDGTAREDVQEVLSDVKGPQTERVALLVDRLLKGTNDALLSQAVWAAAIPRSISPALLRHLLAENDRSEAELTRVVSELECLPFVEKPWGERGSFRLHPFVRNSLVDRMARLERDRFTELHAKAAKYYGVLLGKDKNIASTYGEAFTNEDPQQQAWEREWLYHSGFAASPADRRSVLVDFAYRFFEAFWWWGAYVHSDFCDQLVGDLGHLAAQRNRAPGDGDQALPQVDPEGQAWPNLQKLYKELQTFLKEYPLRSVKPRDANWGSVEDALLLVRRLCELPADPGLKAAQADRHLAGLVSIFQAHVRRYGHGRKPSAAKQLDKADKYYKEAARFFQGNDKWSPNWVPYERADMAFERGDYETVPDLWWDAAGKVQPKEPLAAADVDYELTSNLHRLRADCAWQAGDRVRAAGWYGQAVLHSYLFHFGGPPQEAAPDLYTLQFYVDIRARAINRLRELRRAEEHDAALTCAMKMSRVVHDALGEAPTEDPEQVQRLLEEGAKEGAELPALPIALALFPRGPEVMELENSDTDFARVFFRQYDELELPELLRDLHDPTWP